jgi:hypothetical protein
VAHSSHMLAYVGILVHLQSMLAVLPPLAVHVGGAATDTADAQISAVHQGCTTRTQTPLMAGMLVSNCSTNLDWVWEGLGGGSV